MNLVINQILILFMIILVGYLIRRRNIINDEVTRGLSNLLIEVTIPALIISSFAAVELKGEVLANTILIFVISLIVHVTLLMTARLFFKGEDYSGKMKATFTCLLVFSNTAYMGYPILAVIYPDYGIFYAAIYNIVLDLFIFTYGVYILSDNRAGGTLKLKQFLNNGIIAIFIGFIFMVSDLNLPVIINEALNSLGEVTFPLSMLVIGGSLTNVSFSTILRDRALHLLVFLKLLLLPFLGFLILSQFNLPPVITNITALLIAMPSAAKNVIFARKYNASYNFASKGVFFTTLVSLITIPCLIWFLKII